MAGIIDISDLAHFQRTLQTAGAKLVVVDFTATWCGPCRMIAPVFAALADEYAGRALFLKVDVDAASDVSSFCSVSSMPTFHGYKAANIVFNFSGADRDQLTSEVARHAPSAAEASPFSGAGQSLGGGPPKVDWDYVSPEDRRKQAAAAAAARFGAAGASASADKPAQPASEPTKPAPKPPSKAAAAAVDSLLAADEADAAPPAAAPAPVPVASGVNPRMLAALLEMGFPRPRAVRALHATFSKSSEAAMDWCFEHAEDPASDAPLTALEDVVAADEPAAAGGSGGSGGAAASQLTPAEREAKADELLRKARAKRIAEERAAEIEREKARVREGKEMVAAKAAQEEQQRKRAIEDRRREKREQIEERERIRARLAADKAARMQKFNMPGAAAAEKPAAAPATAAPASRRAPAPPAAGKIQFRLPDGARIEGSFGPEATLAQAAGFVARERPDLAAGAGFGLASMYPKKVYGEADMSTLLTAAGLLPRGALNVQKL